MFTQRKLIMLSVAAFALLLCTFSLCNRSGREAQAQGGGGGPAKQPDQDKLQAADRDAIAKAARNFVTAFEKGDAKAIAAHWTENGEYIADDGTAIRGRTAIEDDYADQFAKRKGTVKVDIDVDAIRFPSRDTAIEEGHFKVRVGKDPAVHSKYTILHVRENGKW